jgi:hypothetical protein
MEVESTCSLGEHPDRHVHHDDDDDDDDDDDKRPVRIYEVLLWWHVYPLLGADRTAAVATQRPANNRGMVFSAWSAKQQLNSNRGTVFCAVRAEIL